MSKVLKFIVNLVVLLSIVVAVALLVPPLLGVDTVINDNSNIETNLPVGAVAYGRQVDTEKLKKEDKILYMEGSAQYVYEIQDMDTTAGSYKVKDVYNKNSDAESITLQDKVSKAVITIPFIGYAAIALQSKTGLMVVGAVIILLIILFILSEVLRRGDDDEEEDEEEYEEEDDDDEEEEEELSAKERRRLKKEEKRRRKLEKKGLLEEDDEEEQEQEDMNDVFVPENTFSEPAASEPEQELQGFDEAMKDAMSSIASGIAQVSEPENVPDATVVMPDAEELEKAVQEAEGTLETAEEPEVQEFAAETELEPEAEETQAVENIEADMPEDIAEDIIIEETPTEETPTEETEVQLSEEEEIPVNVNAVPKTPSLNELLAKAAAAGEEPEVKKDEENEVTLLDYSDLL
ncbi:hypothetical protein HMPREF0992_00734 [Lachnospiraceae bacterium 6_1_63FAA]|nr:hypothetical protein HMPREF0992_00734 [Lachnospiraceae bacterium 6_1_63FAA]